MQKKNYKGRCEKRKLSKAKGVCRFYSDIQAKYGALLDMDASIEEIECNRLMDGFALGEYTCDFLCKKADGDLMVRECVQRKFLVKPMTIKLLDASRIYWLKRGVEDWGIVVEKEGGMGA